MLSSELFAAEQAEAWLQTRHSSNDQIIALSESRLWLRLLHAEKTGILRKSYRSYVDDERFFLSTGSFDPAEELRATLEAFAQKPKTQCRFTGRRLFVAEKMPRLSAALPKVSCVEYRQWLADVSAAQVVLVFAGSYLNSPSSMYGHTLLRIDSFDNTKNNPLLSQALNFAAKVDPNDNGFLYSFKGLFGGYPGLFSMLPYHKKVKEYSRIENRDLWEYKLNLNKKEMLRLLSHVWELERIQFDYYFFDENCSYRLLELLEVARPSISLLQGFDWYAMPVDTVRAVDGAGMIASRQRRPSWRHRLDVQLDQLTEDERAQVLAIVNDGTDYLVLENNHQDRIALVASVTSDYWRYRYGKLPRQQKDIETQFGLLRLVNQYSQSDVRDRFDPEKIELGGIPESGHGTGLLAATVGQLEDENYSEYELKLSYHDLLDRVNGYPQNSSLNIGRFRFRDGEDTGLKFEALDLIEITSLGARDDFFKPLAWQVNVGVERLDQFRQPVVAQLNGGVGYARNVFAEALVYALVNTRIEYGDQRFQELDIAWGNTLGLLGGVRHSRWMLQAKHWQFESGQDRYSAEFAWNIPIETNHALRFSWLTEWLESDKTKQLSFGYRYYF